MAGNFTQVSNEKGSVSGLGPVDRDRRSWPGSAALRVESSAGHGDRGFPENERVVDALELRAMMGG
jgi:hypothetical protein